MQVQPQCSMLVLLSQPMLDNNRLMLGAVLLRALAKVAAFRVTQDSLEPLAKLEPQENQENQEPLADLADHQLCARKSQSHPARPAHLVPQAQLDPMEIQETQDSLDKADDLETQEPQEIKDHQAHLDHLEKLVKTETRENQADLPLQHQMYPANQEPPVTMDPQACQETTDHQETSADPASKDPLVPQAHQANQDLKDQPDQRAHLEMVANREKRVFVPNIALWTEAFSSRMEPDGNKPNLPSYSQSNPCQICPSAQQIHSSLYSKSKSPSLVFDIIIISTINIIYKKSY